MSEKKSKYTAYNSLLTALSRAHIKHPGKIATLLLDLFINGEVTEWQTIDNAMIQDRGIILKSKSKLNVEEEEYRNYTDWRHHICLAGFLEWRLKGVGVNKVNNRLGGLFKPGSKLIPYLNKESFATGQIAMKSDLIKINERLNERMLKLEKMAMNQIEKDDPPATTDKLERRLRRVTP